MRVLGCVMLFWVGACSPEAAGSGGNGSSCVSRSDCEAGLQCIDNRCVEVDAGSEGGTMCPASRMCEDTCCENGETCGGGRCCPIGDLCGGVCCSDDQTCEVDRCVLRCEPQETPCGSGTDVTCCASSDLCYLGACVTPGPACTRTDECAPTEYCEPTAMRCLPRAMGEECEYRPPVGPLELQSEWSWNGSTVLPQHNQVMMAPMVANLTDDNGDGRINELDIPDVVFSTFRGNQYWGDGVLRVVSGADGSPIWPTADPGFRTTPGAEVAIAELDASSPGPEIVACSASTRPSTAGHLMLVSAAGTVLRRFDTAPNDVPCGFDAPAIGDMNGDGTPEIVIRFVIAHADGTVVQRIRDLRSASSRYNTLADVDMDMDLELVSSNGVYEYDGTPLWERTTAGALPAIPNGHTAIADLDLDGTPELIVVTSSDHSVRALNPATGADVWGPIDINPPELAAQVAANGNPGGGGPPTIANFDDDPNPEIAFAGGYAYVIFEHDGSRKWFLETVDRSSRSTGSSIFDFEGDGVAEVLYNDERTFRVFRGPDGTVLHDQCNTSGTLREYPIVVDVDNDNQAEIIVMENNYAWGCLDGNTSGTGIHILGHPRNEWVRTRRIWNQHTYHVTNVEEDGTVPTRETPNWTVPSLNNFRQNVQPEGLFNAPDLVPEDLTALTRSCPVAFELSVRVVNRGTGGAQAGVPVTFYDVTDGGRTVIGRAATSRPLLPGESELVLMPMAFPIPIGRAAETFRFEAVINDPMDMPDPGLNECREGNNASGPVDATCPLLN
ncbi:MAG: VCBS repeat-containing protein [Myxococcota bacterium]